MRVGAVESKHSRGEGGVPPGESRSTSTLTICHLVSVSLSPRGRDSKARGSGVAPEALLNPLFWGVALVALFVPSCFVSMVVWVHR